MKITFTALVLAALALSGCATGSHVITGRARPMTSPDAVKVYSEMPKNAEVLGSVTVENSNGFSHYFGNGELKEFKNQAAQMGANGVVIGAGNVVPLKGYTGGAIAIYVQP